MLRAANHLNVLGTGSDRMAGLGKGLERRAAEPVDRRARGGERQIRHERHRAGHVATEFAPLLRHAEHDILDRIWIDTASLNDGPHDGHGQLIAPHMAKHPSLGMRPADRGAAAGNDDGCGRRIAAVAWCVVSHDSHSVNGRPLLT